MERRICECPCIRLRNSDRCRPQEICKGVGPARISTKTRIVKLPYAGRQGAAPEQKPANRRAFLLAKEKGSTAVNALPNEGGEDVASILPLVYHRKMNPPFRSRSSTGRHTA